MIELTEEQLQRYDKHIKLAEVGIEGQKKLLSAKVFVVGAGGLGSPLGFYLTAAGIGTIGMADNDNVELSNLQRQIAHSVNTLGTSKTESAKKTFNALNPDVNFITYGERVTQKNIMTLIRDYDVIVDCSDNFPSRYLINDACVILNKPLVSGAVLKFEGHVTTIIPKKGHCYRCLFEDIPAEGVVPSSPDTGLLGVLPGVIGSLQAAEVLKLILNIGSVLKNELLIYDALKTNFRKIHIPKNPDCHVCSDNPRIKKLAETPE